MGFGGPLPVSEEAALRVSGPGPGDSKEDSGGFGETTDFISKPMSETEARGVFDLPRIYVRDQEPVIAALKRGEIEYADLTQWSFPDEFFCFLLGTHFLEKVEETYPTPRQKEEVPIWFLISCQFLLKLWCSRRYHHLRYFLNAGSILTRFGFNVGSESIGFNGKNRYERKTAVDPDTVRKFFKDTPPQEIREWHNESLQRWFRGQRVFRERGIFVLDQTHLVVPDNPHYEGAVRMPVDEHGQRYRGYEEFTEEQRKGLSYHPCYSLSLLLHVDLTPDLFHVAGYEWGPGNEDELPQAEKLVPDFCRAHPSVMKELIVDRGYIDGEFIGRVKKDHGVDVLVPLKKTMSTYQDAVGIAGREKQWEVLEEEKDLQGKLIKKVWGQRIPEMDLWDSCPVKQHATVVRQVAWDPETQQDEERIWVLGSTKKYLHSKVAYSRYRLRTQIEERNRQLKGGWQIGRFPSPSPGLMESHLCFTLLTYSLLQLYLRRKDLQEKTHRMIQTLRQEERLGGGAVLVYAGSAYAALKLKDYMTLVLDLDEDPKKRLKEVFQSIQEEG